MNTITNANAEGNIKISVPKAPRQILPNGLVVVNMNIKIDMNFSPTCKLPAVCALRAECFQQITDIQQCINYELTDQVRYLGKKDAEVFQMRQVKKFPAIFWDELQMLQEDNSIDIILVDNYTLTHFSSHYRIYEEYDKVFGPFWYEGSNGSKHASTTLFRRFDFSID